MSSTRTRGAPGAGVRRPPRRTGYHVDYDAEGRPAPDARQGRLIGHGNGANPFTIRPQTREPGDEAVSLWRCAHADGAAFTVAESPDGNTCTCSRFGVTGHCPHVRTLELTGIIKPADRFVLTGGGEP